MPGCGIYIGSSSIIRITYGTHQSCGCATCTFSYTGSDQRMTIPAGSTVTFDVCGAGSNVSAGGKSTGTKCFTQATQVSIMVGGRGNRTDNGTTYGFGGSTTYGGRGGGGLSGVFTGGTNIGDNDSARAIIIAGGAGGGRTGGGAGGGTNGQNGCGGSYGWAGGGASQTAKGSGNQAGGQFHGGGGSGTYGFGGGGGRYGGGGSGGDGSGDDDANAGGGSGYIGGVTGGTTTVGGGSAAGVDGVVKVTYTYDTIVPNEYVAGYLGDCCIRPDIPLTCCFGYTGAEQTVQLPAGTYQLELWGAQGGSYCGTGGKGGYSCGKITFNTATTLYVYVGGAGCGGQNYPAAGWNGGGQACAWCRLTNSGGGGTDIRVGGNTLCHRIIVAGGGGGGVESSGAYPGGSGGGCCGSNGWSYCGVEGGGRSGHYGTQTAGGAPSDERSRGTYNSGTFGVGGTTTGCYPVGGGGGRYGGGTGGPDGAGGGGSGYIRTASNCGLNPNPSCLNGVPFFTEGVTCCGCLSFPAPTGGNETGHTGCGCVIITSVR